MATADSLLSEEHFLCSICLDVFTQPVSLPCGHNFCKACISRCWNSTISGLCQCPMCKETFNARPDLHVNCFISEMADQFRKSMCRKEEQERDEDDDDVPQEVLCEIVEPLGSSMVDRMCTTHNKSLELFCGDEQQLICILCSQTNHKTHAVVFLEDECGKREKQIEERKAECHQMIQERHQKLEEIKHSAELNKELAERELSDCVDICAALAASFQSKQAELLEVMERKQREAEEEAKDLITDLEQEIADIEGRSVELGQLSYSDDLLDFLLQSQPYVHGPPLPVEDWSEVCIDSELCVGTVREAVADLEQAVNNGMEALIQQMEMINQENEEDLEIPTDSIPTDPECTNSVPTNPEFTSPTPINPACTNPVPIITESTDPEATNPESTNHIPTNPGCTNYINITPTPNNPVCNNYITINSPPNNPVCTKYVYVTMPPNCKRTNRRPKRPARNNPVPHNPFNSVRTNTANNAGLKNPGRSYLPNNPGPNNPGPTNPPHNPGPKHPARTNPPHYPGPKNPVRTNPPHNPGPKNPVRTNPPHNPGPKNPVRTNPPHNPGPKNTFCTNPPHNPGPKDTFRTNPHHSPGPKNPAHTNPPHNPGPKNTFRTNPPHNPGPKNHNPGQQNPNHTSHGPRNQHAKQHGGAKK